MKLVEITNVDTCFTYCLKRLGLSNILKRYENLHDFINENEDIIKSITPEEIYNLKEGDFIFYTETKRVPIKGKLIIFPDCTLRTSLLYSVGHSVVKERDNLISSFEFPNIVLYDKTPIVEHEEEIHKYYYITKEDMVLLNDFL